MLKRVVLAIDYKPQDGQPKARLADFRLKSDRTITLTDAQAGDALVQANKSLYVDPVSGKPWRQRGDGSFQIAALSTDNTNRFAAGRVVTITAELSATSAALSLQKRDLTFAPLEADVAVRATSYDSPVVVVP